MGEYNEGHLGWIRIAARRYHPEPALTNWLCKNYGCRDPRCCEGTVMPKIDVSHAPEGRGSRYPAPFDEPCRERAWRRLGDAAGLTQFGVNLVTLKPGAWSSQRHWHAREDEFVYVFTGEVVLVDEAGESPLRPGDCAGFRAGERNGHHFINRSKSDAVLLVVGTRDDADCGEYPDIDLKFLPGRYNEPVRYAHKDGRPY
jgi:uncharacterized cupin superfamily protein